MLFSTIYATIHNLASIFLFIQGVNALKNVNRGKSLDHPMRKSCGWGYIFNFDEIQGAQETRARKIPQPQREL